MPLSLPQLFISRARALSPLGPETRERASGRACGTVSRRLSLGRSSRPGAAGGSVAVSYSTRQRPSEKGYQHTYGTKLRARLPRGQSVRSQGAPRRAWRCRMDKHGREDAARLVCGAGEELCGCFGEMRELDFQKSDWSRGSFRSDVAGDQFTRCLLRGCDSCRSPFSLHWPVTAGPDGGFWLPVVAAPADATSKKRLTNWYGCR